MERYRIIQHRHFEGGVILIEVYGTFMWHTIWSREYSNGDDDYARLCAEEIVEILKEKI